MNYMITSVMKIHSRDGSDVILTSSTGSSFKVYYDPVLGRACAKFIKAEDLVVPYTATDLSDALRISQVLQMSQNDLRKLQVSGFYRDIDLPRPSYKSDKVQDKMNEIEGVTSTDNSG